jgi:hypothetical protein
MPSPSIFGENRGSSPLGSANDFNGLAFAAESSVLVVSRPPCAPLLQHWPDIAELRRLASPQRVPYTAPMLSRSFFIEPCLPSTAERPPSGPDWVHGIKHDGFRLMARRDPARVRLLTRKAMLDSLLLGSRAGVRLNEHLEDQDAVAAGRRSGSSSRIRMAGGEVGGGGKLEPMKGGWP